MSHKIVNDNRTNVKLYTVPCCLFKAGKTTKSSVIIVTWFAVK